MLLFREVDVITPMAEPMWDIERYCLTYKRDGTIYELYDEQQILYPVNSRKLCCVFFSIVRQGTNPVEELSTAPVL